MNDPMPPESLPPESSNLTQSTNLAREAEARRSAVADPRRQYDELIAVVVALFGIGAILFWVLGRGQPFNANPGGGAIAGNTSGNGNPDFAKGRSGDPAAPARSDLNVSGPESPSPATVPSPAAAEASPAAASPVSGAVAGAAGAAAGAAATIAPVTATANNAPASASSNPEIVEPDVLPNATTARKFSDVTTASPIAAYVDALSSRGILDQYNDGTLNPNEPITRGEFANLVSKTFGKPRIKPEMTFKDVPAAAASKAAVVEATRTGFMSGFPDNNFKPDLNIPRYQMQVAIVTGIGLKANSDPAALAQFPDSQAVPKWATEKVATAIGAGILPGKGLKTLSPEQVATRGEAVVMLHEALVKEGKLPAVK
jgi:S-layer homology domain